MRCPVRLRFTPALVLTLAVGWALAAAAPVPKALKAKAPPKTFEQKLTGIWLLVSEAPNEKGVTKEVEYRPGGKLVVRLEYKMDDGAFTMEEVGSYQVFDPDAANPRRLNVSGSKLRGLVKITPGLETVETLSDEVMTKQNAEGITERYVRLKDR
jgi:hypothetical protein